MAEYKENRKWVLVRAPTGMPQESDFKIEKECIPPLNENEFLVKVHYVSCDPGIRTMLGTQIRPGHPIIGISAGSVVKTRNPNFRLGDHVRGIFGLQEYAITTGGPETGVFKLPKDISLAYALGIAGYTGAAAYFGLDKVIRPESGRTIFVSGAAGATGSAAGQIAKLQGLKVYGSAGSQEKIDYLTEELGFDGAVKYKGKDVEELTNELRDLIPEGIDYYFENTGGPIFQAVVNNMNQFGRIAVCGTISTYNNPTDPQGYQIGHSISLSQLLLKQLDIEGFIATRWMSELPQAMDYLCKHIAKGNLTQRESITEGFENAIQGYIELFTGGNIGKKLVHFSEPKGRRH